MDWILGESEGWKSESARVVPARLLVASLAGRQFAGVDVVTVMMEIFDASMAL